MSANHLILCSDFAVILVALNIVSEVADHANESMRHGVRANFHFELKPM